jgi:hypothetical protein
VASSILPDVAGDGTEEFRKLLTDVLKATEQILDLLEHVIAGYLNSIGAKLTHTAADPQAHRQST